mmetsp:Transcript_54804/g.62790  ORF Transcript_54804/g.62790 Transcript_54804/m.62790 type:complete len:145 (-) Transcript_54804:93-527(-)
MSHKFFAFLILIFACFGVFSRANPALSAEDERLAACMKIGEVAWHDYWSERVQDIAREHQNITLETVMFKVGLNALGKCCERITDEEMKKIETSDVHYYWEDSYAALIEPEEDVLITDNFELTPEETELQQRIIELTTKHGVLP